MNSPELVLGGLAALFLLSVVVKVRARRQRIKLAAEIARAGTRTSSLIGRVLVTALCIVGAQWLVMTHSDNVTLKWVVLAAPALVSSFVLVRALSVTHIEPRRRSGGQR